jgi:GNAT superfamily N-acetyltransferase
MHPEHLAPGDNKSLHGDWSGLALHEIRSTDDPCFETAFNALWNEFGEAGEMECPEILADRMKWHPGEMLDGAALLYAMQLVTKNGEFVAACDHTAILLENHPGAIVHHSHILVAPDWRRSGIAGWMRALPVSTALEALATALRPVHSPITLVGEMEPYRPARPATIVRLAAYEKAGFKMIDPTQVDYRQPDFRPPQIIDRENGPRALPLCLLVRRIGREVEDFVSGAEVRHCVHALYKMYARGFREQDMHIVLKSLQSYPAEGARIRLVPPTHAVDSKA